MGRFGASFLGGFAALLLCVWSAPGAFGQEAPERYRIIASQNIFRKLGWRPPQKQETVRLLGVTLSSAGNRALLSRNGQTHYVDEGKSIGGGDRLASVVRGAVEVEDSSGNRRTLQLDAKVLSVGAPAKRRTERPPPNSAPRGKEERDTRWYPPRGASGDAIFEMIMEREGVTWDDIKRDPELAGEIKSRYTHVWKRMESEKGGGGAEREEKKEEGGYEKD